MVHEQTQHNEDRQAALVGVPEERCQYDEHDADSRALGHAGGPAASHSPKLMDVDM
jgi:hypothetical protein